MKKMFKIKNLLFLITILSIVSCSKDDDAGVPPVNQISVENLAVAVDENPTNGDVVGTVQATQTIGGAILSYSITSQTPSGALEIDATTGELTVLDNGLFDFETNPTITANISVTGVANSATVSVNLNDLNEVGEYKFGGVIFWVNAANNQGLVCDINNQDVTSWSCSNYVNTSATGTAIGSGSANTLAIISNSCTSSNGAANVISALSLNGYDDWFLPSKEELDEMYLNRDVIDATSALQGGSDIENPASPLSLWSSSQSANDFNKAWALQFVNASGNDVTKTVILTSRAVRSWTDF